MFFLKTVDLYTEQCKACTLKINATIKFLAASPIEAAPQTFFNFFDKILQNSNFAMTVLTILKCASDIFQDFTEIQNGRN